jgi:ankyrin repeat protein
MRNRLHLNAPTVVAILMLMALSVPAILVASAAESPVADAAMREDINTVRALLREGADVNASQGDGMTALHWSALTDDVTTMEVLLYAGAVVEPMTRLGGYTPLHLAAMQGNSEAVARLLEAGSDGERITDTGVSPLHLAAQAGQRASISALISAGVHVDARDQYLERTPLHFATAHNRLEAIATLVAAGADVGAVTSVTDYPAKSRVDSASRSTRNRIKDAAKSPEERTDFRDRFDGFVPANSNAPADPTLDSKKAAEKTDDPPADGKKPAEKTDDPPADGKKPAEKTKTDDPPAGSGTASTGTTPPDPDDPAGTPRSGGAGRGNRPRPTRSDPNAPKALSGTDQIGTQGAFTALHYAVRDGRSEAALMLLEAGADINHRTADESSPLLLATINGNYDLAKELLARGADPNYVSDDGVGPLFAVVNQEWHLRTWYPQPTANEQQEISYLDLMRLLLEAGADVNARTTTHVWYAAYNAGRMGVDFSGATTFWRAAYALDVDAMKLLVEFGADPNISTLSYGNTTRRNMGTQPFTGQQDSEDTEEKMDPSGLPPSKAGDPAVHALHAAAGVGFGTSRVGQQHRHVPGGWFNAIEYLVDELGVDVNVRSHDGFSAMHNAASRGDNEMIMFLLERGADATFSSRRGQTTIDMANGPQQRVQPFPETIALLERFGAINNNNCISC